MTCECLRPDYNLGVGSGNPHEQTAEIMRRFSELVQVDKPDMVVVAGDVNSTLACALVAVKENILLAHVEAGLRSFDRSMPEEINRLVTDSVSDLLFTTEESGNKNLAHEGIPASKVFFVGNLMIDSLVSALARSHASTLRAQLGVTAQPYILLTLHRPSNVDDEDRLRDTLEAVRQIAQQIPVIFPAHPRTARNIEASRMRGISMWQGGLLPSQGLWMMAPASYLEFLDLMQHAVMVITDSGGVQEETTFLGVPCLTYREHTERPVTVTLGTNRVVGCEPRELVRSALGLLASLGEVRPAVVRQAVARPATLGWANGPAHRKRVETNLAPTASQAWRSTFLSPEAAANDVANLRQAIERLRTWIEARAIAGYEPFDLLNSPYLRGGWARQALPAILLIQAGKRFGGLRLRTTA